MNLPKPRAARKIIIGLLLVILDTSGYVSNNTSEAAGVSETFSDVPRTTNQAATEEGDDSANGVIFPDGEFVPVNWWVGESAFHERYPYDEKFLELQKLARNGNAHAAFSAFGILDACASEPNSIEQVEERVNQLRQAMNEFRKTEYDSEVMSNDELEQRIEQIRSSFAACGRIPSNEIEDREALLRQAAAGDVTDAMNWLGMSTSNHDEAVDVLQRSWSMGSFKVLEHLGWRYQQSFATYREPSEKVRAIATLYLYALLLENAQSLKSREPNSLSADAWDVVERYARRFEQSAIQEAIALAKSMIIENENCCTAR